MRIELFALATWTLTAVAEGTLRATLSSLSFASSVNKINSIDGLMEGRSSYGRESIEPLRMSDGIVICRDDVADDYFLNGSEQKEENSAIGSMAHEKQNHERDNNSIDNDNNDDDGSEDNNPRRGRPGIVVFSGGTAFNSASAEMASRSVGLNTAGGTLGGDISRSNSMSSLMDLMAMGSMEEEMIMITATTSSNKNLKNQQLSNAAGGTKVWHVLPVTDDGGSTAEIVRVLGGPAVGDIRSRLLRLAPGTTREARAVRRLLGHRLVSMQSFLSNQRDNADNVNEEEVTHERISRMAREEWLDILDGGQESYQEHQANPNNNVDEDDSNSEHPLWKDVSAPYRSIIRAFLVHFHTQILQTHNGIRHSPNNPPFDFTGGSVGNFFFAGARTFFGSLPAAIFLFSKVAGIPSGSRVIPAVLSSERLVLGAELMDGTRIRGQYNISHPSPKNVHDKKPQSATPRQKNTRDRSGSNSSMSRHRAVVKKSTLDSKEAMDSLHPSPMSRVAFLLHDPTWRRRNENSHKNEQQKHQHQLTEKAIPTTQQQWSDRHEISPEPNPLVLDAISNANCIVYGCGSLFTSVLPSLVLDGVGSAISSRSNVPKVLLLNGWHDCETSWVESSEDGCERVVKRMDATCFVKAVVEALQQGEDLDKVPLVTDYITHIFYPIGTEIEIDEQSLANFCMSPEDSHTSSSQEERKKQKQDHHQPSTIQLQGIKSIAANSCSEGTRSGGQSHHSVFDPRALVDALLDLAT